MKATNEARTVTLRMEGASVSYDVGTRRAWYRRADQVTAIQNVTLELCRGESVAVLGRNGAGKSTLLRAMAGLAPLSQGSVKVARRPVLLSVGAALLPDLTGRRNALLGCLALGLSGPEARRAAAEAVEFARLGEAADRPLRGYSSGMAMRLRFAVATAAPQEILLMDETLAVGDADFRRDCNDRLARVRSESGTVVLVAHATGVLRENCTRGIVLEQGRLVFDGTTEDAVDFYDRMIQTSGRSPA